MSYVKSLLPCALVYLITQSLGACRTGATIPTVSADSATPPPLGPTTVGDKAQGEPGKTKDAPKAATVASNGGALTTVKERTTPGKAGQAVEATPVTPAEGSPRTSSSISQEVSQQFFDVMVAMERQMNRKIDLQKLHNVSGVILCRDQGETKCEVRVRLPAHKLTQRQPLRDLLTTAALRLLREARPDIAKTTSLLLDVTCDHLGAKTPPYTLETTTCRFESPRATNEAIIDGDTAQDVALLLRSSQAFDEGKSVVSGSITCSSIRDTGKPDCSLRAIAGTVLVSQVHALPATAAKGASELMFQTYFDHYALAKESSASAPRTLTGAVLCEVDSSDVITLGQRNFLCRVTL